MSKVVMPLQASIQQASQDQAVIGAGQVSAWNAAYADAVSTHPASSTTVGQGHPAPDGERQNGSGPDSARSGLVQSGSASACSTASGSEDSHSKGGSTHVNGPHSPALDHVIARSAGAASSGAAARPLKAILPDARKVAFAHGTKNHGVGASSNAVRATTIDSNGSSDRNMQPPTVSPDRGGKDGHSASADASVASGRPADTVKSAGMPDARTPVPASGRTATDMIFPQLIGNKSASISDRTDGPKDAQTRRQKALRHPVKTVSQVALPAQPTTIAPPEGTQHQATAPVRPERDTSRSNVSGISAHLGTAFHSGALMQGVSQEASGRSLAAQMTPESQAHVFQSVTDLAVGNGGSARITLHPESLGSLVVKVEITSRGVVNIHMTASSQDGYYALSATTGLLAQHMAHSGLTVGSLQTAMAPGSSGQSNSGQAGQSLQPVMQPALQGGGQGGTFSGFHQNAGGGRQKTAHQDLPSELTNTDSSDGTDETVKAYA